MTEGWVDCPSLGPGWQRREVLRKNGTRPGQSDTYYMSPRGEKIRSRVELTRLLGCSRDLRDFDFKKGIFLDPSAEPPAPPPLPPAGGSHWRPHIKKSRKRRPPSLAAAPPLPKKPPDLKVLEEPPDRDLPDQKPLKLKLELPMEEAPLSVLTEQQEPPAPADQPAPKPRKRRRRNHLPPILAPGSGGEATVQETNPEETVACCASCQVQFPGVMLPTQRRCRWLCPDCRAQRRDFNREQRYYKQIGCGVCQACQMSQDCGICSVCVLRAKSPELRIGIKCLLRRCLKIVKKGLECGLCQACKITEDCGDCVICLRRQKPGMKRQWKCLRRRCLKRKKWKPTMERDPGNVSVAKSKKKQLEAVKERKMVGHPPKHPSAKLKKSVHASKSRQNRKCGECEACLLKTDCGRCDFCCDKPKFGGQNLKRQKCRWRQCLQFAMQECSSSGEPVDPPKPHSPEKPQQQQQLLPPLSLLPPLELKNKPEGSGFTLAQGTIEDHRTPAPPVKQEPEAPCCPTPPIHVLAKESDTRLPAVNLLIATSPKIKQDHVEPGGDRRPSNDSPVLAGLPQVKRLQRTQQGGEVVVLDDEEDDEEVEQQRQIRPPVIMEILSLGGVQPLNQLDSVLREFLNELNEIPLPAHWEVLPPVGGPDLRLVQRSKHSTMSAAVIHIRPGLFFHVVVRDLPVPPGHKLYASHPARLTTVDEVVELICDLEAYQLCSGWPAGWHAGRRSEACDVLVYSGCCPQCRLNPWPSGSGTC
uniref:Methyl-CpG-binding domain protein 1 isoform X7 n=1 Tax=Pogona vitticeps TaxID=103695 RepID=A0A6J0U056_9SAUR